MNYLIEGICPNGGKSYVKAVREQTQIIQQAIRFESRAAAKAYISNMGVFGIGLSAPKVKPIAPTKTKKTNVKQKKVDRK